MLAPPRLKISNRAYDAEYILQYITLRVCFQTFWLLLLRRYTLLHVPTQSLYRCGVV